MATSIQSLINKLVPDPWRRRVGFSPEVEKTNRELFDESKSDEELSLALRAWLTKRQPCLFGRLAAGTLDLISVCVLTERDLMQSDRHIKGKIQKYRLLWRQEGFQGRRSGFIIHVILPRIAVAAPDENLKALAIRLCSLYLIESIVPDEIHHDTLRLEVPADSKTGEPSAWYEWRVGVNYFSSQGDMRWWHDHRIPGGLAFSMNSVGHMARSGALRNVQIGSLESSEQGKPIAGKMPIDSLGTSLKVAMLTINGAQETPSGPATCLRKLDRQAYDSLQPKCPIAHPLPPQLQSMDYTTYLGWYHTDATIPSDYFRPDPKRPEDVQQKELDFRYLFDDDIDNPDFETTGYGVRIR